MTASSIDDQLHALQRGYAERLPQRALELRQRASALAAHWDAAEALELRRLAHNLAGSGASYGFPEVTAAARTLERALDTALDTPPPAATLAEIHRAVAELVTAVGGIRSD